MRIIAGEFRSRLLKPVPGYEVRPTPDRLRETLFNILAPKMEGAVFLDAYAGTGAVGLEAVSRGAAKAILIEKSKEVMAVIEENVRRLRLGARVQALRGSVQLLLPRYPADIVFLDPPYTMPAEYEIAMRVLGDQGAPLVIAQHESKLKLEETYGLLHRYRVVKQGDNCLSFYRPAEAAPERQEASGQDSY